MLKRREDEIQSEADGITTVSIAGGQRLRYSRTGSGPPLVLLHTIRTQLEYFRRLVPLLEQHFTVYAVDLPGHGHSSIDTSAAYDEPYFRAGIVSFIEALDLKGVTIVGESIGAVLALSVAGSLPDRVSGVVASNAYDYDRHYGDGVRRGNLFANFILGTFQVPVVGAINSALENRLFLWWILRGGVVDSKNMTWDLVGTFDRSGRRRGFRTVERRTFAGWRSWGEARALYPKVKVPVTFIYGAQDWSRDVERGRSTSAVVKARVETLEDTGHFAALERPLEITQIIRDSNAQGRT